MCGPADRILPADIEAHDFVVAGMYCHPDATEDEVVASARESHLKWFETMYNGVKEECRPDFTDWSLAQDKEVREQYKRFCEANSCVPVMSI